MCQRHARPPDLERDDDGAGDGVGVGERQAPAGHAQVGGQGHRSTVEPQLRRAGLGPGDLDVVEAERPEADLPTITTDRTETPATTHPLGVKGVGEAGTIASTPAVVNAVVDALRPRGVHDIQMPLTPERVWRAAQSGGAA